MKKIFIVSLLLIAVSLSAQSSIKIGFVDSQVILAQYAPAIKAQSDLDALTAKWSKSRDSMVTVLQAQYGEYEKQKELMTADKQRETQQALVKKQQEIQFYEQSKFGQPNGELYRKNEELLSPIKEKIMNSINEVAKAEGMNFIFDKTGDVLLLYADSEYDMTYKVLDKLKRGK
ncbi:MAG: OmpH family outer membrane protein [Bacteroidetes bacterium]|nr:OmpH family outer membrane protein [Bacteroidota bacterium]MBU1680008.1 OmpH family outer membrane protein [Bacteroidota bacterium]MBU2505911.1 OmpH family outer membrane protein [Bacteroidota bacterium]